MRRVLLKLVPASIFSSKPLSTKLDAYTPKLDWMKSEASLSNTSAHYRDYGGSQRIGLLKGSGVQSLSSF